MLNLIRMNLFRMVHTRGLIVVFVLLMGFSVLNGSMSAYYSEEMAKEIEEQKTGAQQENPGLVIEVQAPIEAHSEDKRMECGKLTSSKHAVTDDKHILCLPLPFAVLEKDLIQHSLHETSHHISHSRP